MTIVYLYTALCTVGGADRSIIQKANYLAERIVELMGEGFGFYDVRRWAKAPYFINRQEKGII